MGDMAEVFNAMREAKKQRGEKNLLNAFDDGNWSKHTEYHWSRNVGGKRLDFWPSRNKWQYEGRIMCGNVQNFIAKRSNHETKQ